MLLSFHVYKLINNEEFNVTSYIRRKKMRYLIDLKIKCKQNKAFQKGMKELQQSLSSRLHSSKVIYYIMILWNGQIGNHEFNCIADDQFLDVSLPYSWTIYMCKLKSHHCCVGVLAYYLLRSSRAKTDTVFLC